MEKLFTNPVTYLVILALIGTVWKIARWTQKIDQGHVDFREFVKEIKDDIKEIRGHILDIFNRLPPVPTAGKSPLQLTDFGEKIAARLEAYQWGKRIAPTLLTKVKGKQPFEIDEFSNAYVNDCLDEQWHRLVAEGAYEFGIDRDGVLSVLRVILRDELLRLTEQTPP